MTLDELKKICAEANEQAQAPWYADKARPDGYVVDQDVVRASKPINFSTDVVAVCNRGATFISTFNPDFVAKLLAVVEKANAYVGRPERGNPALMDLIGALSALSLEKK